VHKSDETHEKVAMRNRNSDKMVNENKFKIRLDINFNYEYLYSLIMTFRATTNKIKLLIIHLH